MNSKMTLLFLIASVIFGCSQENSIQKIMDTDHKVISFLTDMNPELHQKFDKITAEIVRADEKLQQLHELNKFFPKQSDIINKALQQWQGLRQNLYATLKNIYSKVEGAYVAYRIDEIQGRKQFGELSKNLLTEANAVLANAEITKTTIEKELYQE
jgi:hypothetical protein